MTCNCITDIENKLEEHTLETAIMFGQNACELTCQTFTGLKRRDTRKSETRSGKPRIFAHTFCPFCGTRYRPEKPQADTTELPAVIDGPNGAECGEAIAAARAARQAPYSGFMPDDGLEPGIILSRDNPARPASPAAGEA